MEKLYLIYTVGTGELYAWTQDKKNALWFIQYRKAGYFKLKKEKYDIDDPVSRFRLGMFRERNSQKLIFICPLGGKFDTIDFPITYEENFHVQDFCDKSFDVLIDLSRKICMYPLTDKFREVIERLSWHATVGGGKNIYCDTFGIFMKLYGNTVI